jgi:phosphopantothenoylcysteine decarboxylase / phosphopantothenate---cysteine ligase
VGELSPAPRLPWEGRSVVLGVSGGIAAYKSVQLARDLTLLGARVDVVMTRAAGRFVGAVSFQGVTGRPALDSLWSAEGAALHIRLARQADVVVVAPATADLMARAAQGRADDLLTTLMLATRAPVLMAPAMNDAMWAHPQTRRNAAHLSEALGYEVVGPAEGRLAVGEGSGPGRMVEPDLLVDHVGRILGRRATWEGRRVVVTAGPTREPVDPVRFLGNRSSGRMGYALAREAMLRGAEVTLISGPTHLSDPPGVTVHRVETAEEMLTRAREAVPEADVVVYAAAVADFRPVEADTRKKGKRDAGETLTLELTQNPDIALETAALRRASCTAVGFALESEHLLENAARKLKEKGFDLIVANPAGEEGVGMDSDHNRVAILDGRGEPDELPTLSKVEVASRILDRVEGILKEEGRDR